MDFGVRIEVSQCIMVPQLLCSQVKMSDSHEKLRLGHLWPHDLMAILLLRLDPDTYMLPLHPSLL